MCVLDFLAEWAVFGMARFKKFYLGFVLIATARHKKVFTKLAVGVTMILAKPPACSSSTLTRVRQESLQEYDRQALTEISSSPTRTIKSP